MAENLPMSQEEAMKIVEKVMTDKNPVTININVMEVWMLIGPLQLITRHPDLSDHMKQFGEHMGRQFQEIVASVHPEANALIEMGWNPRFDVDGHGDFVNDIDGNKPMVVHNIFTLYTDDDKEDADALLSFGFRPQDWGDPKWKYKNVRIIFKLDGQEIDHTAHFWYTQKLSDSEFMQEAWVRQMLTQVMLPGCAKEVCGRDYLREDDFWLDEWGKMPPHFEKEYDDDDYEEDDED